MSRFAPIAAAAAALLVVGCGNTPDQPSGEKNASQAAAATANMAEQEGVVPPDAVAQPGYGTENAAGDVLDSQDSKAGNLVDADVSGPQ